MDVIWFGLTFFLYIFHNPILAKQKLVELADNGSRLLVDDQQELGGASEIMLEQPFSSSASFFSSGRISSTASEREDIHVNDSGNAIVVLCFMYVKFIRHLLWDFINYCWSMMN